MIITKQNRRIIYENLFKGGHVWDLQHLAADTDCYAVWV